MSHLAKWTYVTVCDEATKYDTRTEFNRRARGAYTAAKATGLLDRLFPPLPRGPRPSFWNETNLMLVADNYKKRSTFARNARSAYNAAKRLNLLDTLYPLTKKAKPVELPDWLK